MIPSRNTMNADTFSQAGSSSTARTNQLNEQGFNSSLAAQQSASGYTPPAQPTYADAPASPASYHTTLNDNFSRLGLGDDIAPGDSASNVGATTLGRTDNLPPVARQALDEANEKFKFAKQFIDMRVGVSDKGLEKKDFNDIGNSIALGFSSLSKASDNTPRLKQFVDIASESMRNLKAGSDKTANATNMKTASSVLHQSIDLFKFAQQPNPTTGKAMDLPNMPFTDKSGARTVAEAINNVAGISQKRSFNPLSNTAHKEAVGDFADLNKIGKALQEHLNSPENVQKLHTSGKAQETLSTGRLMSHEHQSLITDFTSELGFYNRRLSQAQKSNGMSEKDFKVNKTELQNLADKLVVASSDVPRMHDYATIVKGIAANLPSSTFNKKANKDNMDNLLQTFNDAASYLPVALQADPQTGGYRDLPNVPVRLGAAQTTATVGEALQSILRPSANNQSAKKEAVTDLFDLLGINKDIMPRVTGQSA